ncbi:unnamed protein product, partial [Meganyctiphanes norvegica]
WRHATEGILIANKLYLKRDYKAHIELESQVADHCIGHALSCPREVRHQAFCNHQHNLPCHACEELKKCMQNIDDAFDELNFPSEAMKADLQYRFCQSRKAVQAWKAHQLRSVNQDHARIDILQGLTPNSAFITQ